jgi:hypothetical protein
MLSQIKIRSFGFKFYRGSNPAYPIEVNAEFYYASNQSRTYDLAESWSLAYANQVHRQLGDALDAVGLSSAGLSWDY